MKADKDKITRLLKTARGQIDGLLKMVDDDRYCIDISNQLSATQAILQKVNNEIIQSHLKSCVKDSFDTGSEEDKDEKIEEIVKLLDKLSK
ncbi:metal-sensing transcriptional repressor [Anaerocolumna sp. AGMB13020]|uniref:metal-sensing transcriptional repressor n=1 Tax=Anaerocolumna sp. AGMB13020 TaxID=3081750 RepID=UPI0029537A7A|nr:metal-sensing transcriptional repressor [Anaerocolumna sp. AGMB13020]WOO36264.1 metal-sensing transcriptional repressor [Anaerocolumna sp. AGMB13020]